MRSRSFAGNVALMALVGLVGGGGWWLGRFQGLQGQFNRSYNTALANAHVVLGQVQLLHGAPTQPPDELRHSLYISLATAFVEVETEIAKQKELTFLNTLRSPRAFLDVSKASPLTPLTFDGLLSGLAEVGLSRAQLDAAVATELKRESQ